MDHEGASALHTKDLLGFTEFMKNYFAKNKEIGLNLTAGQEIEGLIVGTALLDVYESNRNVPDEIGNVTQFGLGSRIMGHDNKQTHYSHVEHSKVPSQNMMVSHLGGVDSLQSIPESDESMGQIGETVNFAEFSGFSPNKSVRPRTHPIESHMHPNDPDFENHEFSQFDLNSPESPQKRPQRATPHKDPQAQMIVSTHFGGPNHRVNSKQNQMMSVINTKSNNVKKSLMGIDEDESDEEWDKAMRGGSDFEQLPSDQHAPDYQKAKQQQTTSGRSPKYSHINRQGTMSLTPGNLGSGNFTEIIKHIEQDVMVPMVFTGDHDELQPEIYISFNRHNIPIYTTGTLEVILNGETIFKTQVDMFGRVQRRTFKNFVPQHQESLTVKFTPNFLDHADIMTAGRSVIGNFCFFAEKIRSEVHKSHWQDLSEKVQS